MFFWRKRSDVTVYQGDPVWRVVLAQIKTQALALSPYLQLSENSDQAKSKVNIEYQQFETFLSQIDDSCSLTDRLFLKKANLRVASLAQIVEDLTENYDRRFGHLQSSKVFVLVDPALPEVRTYPGVVLRILDCFLRAAERLAADTGATISIQQTGASDKQQNIVIELRDLGFASDEKRLNESLRKFRAGKYGQSLQDLGLDLVAGLHLAAQLGVTGSFVSKESSKAVLELSLPLEVGGELVSMPASIEKFVLYSPSAQMRERFKQLAGFHKVELSIVDSVENQNSTYPILIDMSDESHLGLLDGASEALLKTGVFLVSTRNGMAEKTLRKSGATNFIYMPLASTKLFQALSQYSERSDSTSTESKRASRPLNILIVDDTETARIVLREHLGAMGHSVTEAFDGSELIARVQRGEHFDLAFCDLNMVHVDGLTAVRALREHEKQTQSHTYVALMTAYQPDDEVQELNSCGANCLIKKPIAPEDIEKVLASVEV